MAAQKAQAFVETEAGEQSGARTSSGARVTLHVGEDAKVDWGRTPDHKLTAFVDALKNDPEGLQALGLQISPDGEVSGLPQITEEQVAHVVDAIAYGNSLITPWMVARKTKGRIQISPETARAACKVPETVHAEICPAGARALNAYIPDAWKMWIARMAPSADAAKFLFGLYMMVQMQADTMMKVTLAQIVAAQRAGAPGTAAATVQPKPNGEATTETVFGETEQPHAPDQFEPEQSH